MTNNPGLFVFGLGSVGSNVLEQILRRSDFSRIGAADSGYSIVCPSEPKASRAEALSYFLSAKRSGNGIDSLSGRVSIAPSSSLLDYIQKGDIVINAMPTEFDQYGDISKIPSLLTDRTAMEKGAHVVAAHKSAFGSTSIYNELMETAAKNSVEYVPAGAIMGPTRVAELFLWLKENNVEVVKARGVINGTTGHILTEMYKGRDYDEVVAEAIELGIAEKDPASDTQGHDALSKMKAVGMILGTYQGSNLFGIGDERAKLPDGIGVQFKGTSPPGIEGITQELLKKLLQKNRVMRLVGTYDSKTGIAQVGPEALESSNPLYPVSGRQNKMVLELSGQMDLIRMLAGIYSDFLCQPGESFAVTVKYPVQLTELQNANGSPTQFRRLNSGYHITFGYNPYSKQLVIEGPGAGGPETAAALLSAVNRIMHPAIYETPPADQRFKAA